MRKPQRLQKRGISRKAALAMAEREVKDTTREHNFYLVASKFVRELYQEQWYGK